MPAACSALRHANLASLLQQSRLRCSAFATASLLALESALQLASFASCCALAQALLPSSEQRCCLLRLKRSLLSAARWHALLRNLLLAAQSLLLRLPAECQPAANCVAALLCIR